MYQASDQVGVLQSVHLIEEMHSLPPFSELCLLLPSSLIVSCQTLLPRLLQVPELVQQFKYKNMVHSKPMAPNPLGHWDDHKKNTGS